MFLDLATETGKGDWSVIRAFLKIAVTLAILQSLGTVPVLKLSWNIVVRNGVISTAISFSILAVMRAGPDTLLGLSWCRSFVTPSLLTLISGIAGYGTPSGVGIFFSPHRFVLPIKDVSFVLWVSM